METSRVTITTITTTTPPPRTTTTITVTIILRHRIITADHKHISPPHRIKLEWSKKEKGEKKKDEANKKFNYHSLFYLPRRWFTWMQKQPNQIKLASAIWLMDYEQKPEIL